MFMWGDRLLDSKATGYHDWEASINDTFDAIDKIPRDIVICDWHYEKMDNYPSVSIFTSKGFRTVICPWQKADAAQAFVEYARNTASENLMGVLSTSWCDSGDIARYLCGVDEDMEDRPKNVSEVFKHLMKV